MQRCVNKRLGGHVYSEVFDPRRNSLNAIRLLLAVLVIAWHSFPLTGHDIPFHPARQFISNVPVDAFFAISGYLICSSWTRRPTVRAFLGARIRRIMPAFWVCLLVTAFLFAPLTSATINGSNVLYVLTNSALYINQVGIDGTLQNVPYPAAWNGSLWTLWWEFACYLGVLILGVTGLITKRGTIAAAFVAAVAGSTLTTTGIIENAYVVHGSRFGVMFLAGAVIWRYRQRIPVNTPLIIAATTTFLATLTLPNYRLIGALPLAYLVLVIGALVKKPNLHTDISYGTYVYAFPVQQIVASAGVRDPATMFIVSVAVTLPIAYLSWVFVERPWLNRGRRSRETHPTGTTKKARPHPAEAR